MTGIDTMTMKVLDSSGTKQVVADASYHHDVCSAKPSRDRLVGAFPTESQIESISKNRLTRLGECLCKRSEINVGTANYGYRRRSHRGQMFCFLPMAIGWRVIEHLRISRVGSRC